MLVLYISLFNSTKYISEKAALLITNIISTDNFRDSSRYELSRFMRMGDIFV